jgi:Outer membrane protein beta-barrel domain
MRQALAIAVLAVGFAGSAQAQEEAGEYRTAFSVVGGLSVGSSTGLGDGRGGFGRGSGAGFAVGGGVAHDFSPRLTLEATGLYLDRAAGAWSADAGLRLNLVPSREATVPYFAVSGGVYGSRERDVNAQRRARDDRRALPGGESSRADGLMTLGGGVLFSAGPHVFVRPDVRAQVVFSGDSRVRGLFTLNFGYRF